MFKCIGFISTSPFTPSLLITYLLSTFTLPSTPPPPTSTQLIKNSPPHPQRTPRPPQNLRILRRNAGGLSPSRRAKLIAFLSNNQYDLILLQETPLSATKKFQIPGYSTLRTDWTFARQGAVSSGGQNTGGGVLTLVYSDMAFSSVFVFSLSSQDLYSDYICVKVFSNHSSLQFLNLYSSPIRNTPSGSSSWTISPDILPKSPDTFILGDFNAHHPSWDSFISPDPLQNELFRLITSSGLEILNDPASPTLFHHSTGSRSSPDISLAPASLAPHCEWLTLPGLGSDHLPIETILSLSPVRHTNTRHPKLNYKKARWDVYQSYFVEHLPSFDVDLVNRSFDVDVVNSPLFWCWRSPPGWLLLFPLLSRSCQGLYPLLVVPPMAGGPRKRNLQCGGDGGPAPRHTGLRLTASDT